MKALNCFSIFLLSCAIPDIIVNFLKVVKYLVEVDVDILLDLVFKYFDYGAYLMNVIPEAHRVHFIRYLRIYMSTLLDIYVFTCPLY